MLDLLDKIFKSRSQHGEIEFLSFMKNLQEEG